MIRAHPHLGGQITEHMILLMIFSTHAFSYHGPLWISKYFFRILLGYISKQGNVLLRFLLVEAAQVTMRSLPEWRSKLGQLNVSLSDGLAVSWTSRTSPQGSQGNLVCNYGPRLRPQSNKSLACALRTNAAVWQHPLRSTFQDDKATHGRIRDTVLSGFDVTRKPIGEGRISCNRGDEVIPATELFQFHLVFELVAGLEMLRSGVAGVGIQNRDISPGAP